MTATITNNTPSPMLSDTNTDQNVLLTQMLSQLSADEVEVAARASYEYLQNPNPKLTEHYAKAFANRFLECKDGNVTKALKRMRETLKFRSEIRVDELRTAFDHDGNTSLAKSLEQEMQAKNVYVQGYDKEGRSTYIFVPRNVQDHGPFTISQHVYNLERAVASSKANDKTVNAVVDFNGFSLKNAPPTHIGKEFMTTLRNHYAGTIHGIYLIDAPSSFLCLWALFKSFVGKKTRSKIHFVQSSQNTLEEFYEADQTAPWMMQGGSKNRELDIHEYLYETAFNQAFDEN